MLIRFLKKEAVLCAASLCALLSMLLVPPDRGYLGYIDAPVLALLLALMLAVAGLERAGAFARLTGASLRVMRGTRSLAAVLVLLCFTSSMILTNDVALITFVPFAISVLCMAGQTDLLIPVVVLQTVAANLGSMLTPMGNPQNLYLYTLAGLSPGRFLSVMAWPTLLSLGLLLLALLLIPRRPLKGDLDFSCQYSGARCALWAAAFCVCLGAVARLYSNFVALLLVLLLVLAFDRSLLRKADWSLLATFVAFFIFVGNVQRMPQISALLAQLVNGRERLCAVAASQIISNVPAAVLLSGFTDRYAELLIGVNLGGLGTLIASMASLISYRRYVAIPGARRGRYLAVFTAVNVAFLAILWVLA